MFKEKLLLLAAHPDLVAITLTTGLLGVGRANIQHTVDLKPVTIDPCQYAGPHSAIGIKGHIDVNILTNIP